jgi:hypothetical protein
MAKSYSFQIGFQVRDGKLVIEGGEISRAVKSWPDCEGTLTLDTEETRSNAANRYLFGVIYRDIHAETGQPVKDIHDEMCVRFTTETIHYTNPKTGEIVELEVVRRTSGMKTTRFHKFVQDVKLHASEFFGLTFEEPGDDVRQEYERAAAREKGKAA